MKPAQHSGSRKSSNIKVIPDHDRFPMSPLMSNMPHGEHVQLQHVLVADRMGKPRKGSVDDTNHETTSRPLRKALTHYSATTMATTHKSYTYRICNLRSGVTRKCTGSLKAFRVRFSTTTTTTAILAMSTVLNTCSRSQYRSYVTVFRYNRLPCQWRL